LRLRTRQIESEIGRGIHKTEAWPNRGCWAVTLWIVFPLFWWVSTANCQNYSYSGASCSHFAWCLRQVI